MSRSLPRWTSLLSLAAALTVAATVFAQDKDQSKKKAGRPDRDSVTSVSPEHQRVSGVIIKAETIRREASSRSKDNEREKGQEATHRITINPDIVWRDWVRDQAGFDGGASPREAARRGANSVATKGEPQSEGSLIVIDVGPNTRIETLFRVSTDETSRGFRTPAEARAASEDPATVKAKGKSVNSRDKKAETTQTTQITRFQADDLLPGLFVVTDYRRQNEHNIPSTFAVVRPVDDSKTTDQPVSEEGKSTGKTKSKSEK